MDASSHASWSRIPRDYHEQQRVQLEHRLFASTARSNSISESSFNLEEEGEPNNLNFHSDSDNDNEANGRQLRYSSSEFSMEFPRNPQVALDDYSLSNPHRRDTQPREGDTRSTFAHHASGITFRTGLRGPSHSRRRDFSGGDLSNGLTDLSFDYDPDRPLDALIRRANDLSILQDSPRDNKSEFTTRAQGLAKQMASNSYENSYKEPAHLPATGKNKESSFAAANVTIKPAHKPLSELARSANTPLKSAFATSRVFPAYVPMSGKAGLQLPDVTGITSAVATPLKGEASFRRVPDPKPTSALTSKFSRQQKSAQPSSSKPAAQPEKAATADPAVVLDTLSHRIHQIERESLTSRRRVTELERELDLCRSVVDNERSKMGELSMRAERKRRSRGNQNSFSRDGRGTNAQVVPELDAAALDASFRETQRRYREAVGEEKELEALVKALHAHLRRTSTTVESHKQMINDLRSEMTQAARERAQQQQHERRASSSKAPTSREADMLWDEVERVKSEVELLWGDVGRLRGVVEGGLGLRRTRDGGVIGRPGDGADVIAGSIVRGDSLRDMSDQESVADSAEEEELSNHDQEPAPVTESQEEYMQRPEWEAPVLSAVLEEDEPASTRGSARSATQPLRAPGRFIQDAELERVRAEVEERRSLRSLSMSGSDRSGSGVGTALRNRASDKILDAGAGGRASPKPTSVHTKVPSSLSTSRLPAGSRNGLQQPTPHRPLTPDSEGDLSPVASREQAKQQSRPERVRQADKDAQRAPSPLSPALPQIRGERLERIFYAAPEHNSRTCRTCHRRRHADGPRNASNSPTVSAPAPTEEEIKFCEGDEHRIAEIAKQSGVPPQTVLARVLRGLEDDFTHYKSIYVELADQYKAMDAASDMGKRNLLASHLREVIDILEQKGDQIASLYDLLHFEDKPLAAPAPVASSSRHRHHHSHCTRLA